MGDSDFRKQTNKENIRGRREDTTSKAFTLKKDLASSVLL